jgi:uncharacterized protein (TIGR03382 family)
VLLTTRSARRETAAEMSFGSGASLTMGLLLALAALRERRRA